MIAEYTIYTLTKCGEHNVAVAVAMVGLILAVFVAGYLIGFYEAKRNALRVLLRDKKD